MRRDYKQLKVFWLAHELVFDIYRETTGFPADERFGAEIAASEGGDVRSDKRRRGCASPDTPRIRPLRRDLARLGRRGALPHRARSETGLPSTQDRHRTLRPLRSRDSKVAPLDRRHRGLRRSRRSRNRNRSRSLKPRPQAASEARSLKPRPQAASSARSPKPRPQAASSAAAAGRLRSRGGRVDNPRNLGHSRGVS